MEIAHDILAIVHVFLYEAVTGRPLNPFSYRVIAVGNRHSIRTRNLRQTVLEIPGVLPRPAAVRFRDQVAVVVVGIACSTRTAELVAWLVTVDRGGIREWIPWLLGLTLRRPG